MKACLTMLDIGLSPFGQLGYTFQIGYHAHRSAVPQVLPTAVTAPQALALYQSGPALYCCPIV